MFNFLNTEIKSPVFLAPLAGFTDMPFRILCHEQGAGMVFTELISAEGIIRKNQKTLDLMQISSDEQPVSIQIFGNNATIMGDAAAIVETLKPTSIDINMGCCAPKVCNGMSGAALLKDLDLLYKIAENVVNNVTLPVSAKIRIGWSEETKNYFETITALQDAGIKFISVHGRTRQQKYSGNADWQIIAKIAEFAKVPIIGNGDILSYAEARTRLEESKCAAVMIGRAALGNPWIFSDRTPTKLEIIETTKRHIDMMIKHYGEYGIILMRKHIVKYIHGFRNASNVRGKLVLSTSRNEMFNLLDSIEI